MTKNEATVLETDAVIFPMKFEREKGETNASESQPTEIAAESQSVRINVETRFARLKKSLRKRAASIL